MAGKKQVTCPNCAAVFSRTAQACPYCGATNPEGAEKAYRKKLSVLRRALDGLSRVPGRELLHALHAEGRPVRRLILAVLLIAGSLLLGGYLLLQSAGSSGISAWEELLSDAL